MLPCVLAIESVGDCARHGWSERPTPRVVEARHGVRVWRGWPTVVQVIDECDDITVGTIGSGYSTVQTRRGGWFSTVDREWPMVRATASTVTPCGARGSVLVEWVMSEWWPVGETGSAWDRRDRGGQPGPGLGPGSGSGPEEEEEACT